MKLSIIITHYHTPEILMKCLASIKNSGINTDYEIVVSDGETDEGLEERLKKDFPEIIFVGHKKNVGFARLVNDGIKKSRGEFIFVINADIIFTGKSDILAMIDYLTKNPEIGILGPRLFNLDGSTQQTYFRNYSVFTILARRTFFSKTKLGQNLLGRFFYKDVAIDGVFEPDWILGAAFLMKKDNLNKIGGQLDERYFMYFEDTDLCRSFKNAGMKVIYFPFAEFIHHHIRTSDKRRGLLDISTNKYTRIHIASYLKYLWKWGIIERGFNKKIID